MAVYDGTNSVGPHTTVWKDGNGIAVGASVSAANRVVIDAAPTPTVETLHTVGNEVRQTRIVASALNLDGEDTVAGYHGYMGIESFPGSVLISMGLITPTTTYWVDWIANGGLSQYETAAGVTSTSNYHNQFMSFENDADSTKFEVSPLSLAFNNDDSTLSSDLSSGQLTFVAPASSSTFAWFGFTIGTEVSGNASGFEIADNGVVGLTSMQAGQFQTQSAGGNGPVASMGPTGVSLGDSSGLSDTGALTTGSLYYTGLNGDYGYFDAHKVDFNYGACVLDISGLGVNDGTDNVFLAPFGVTFTGSSGQTGQLGPDGWNLDAAGDLNYASAAGITMEAVSGKNLSLTGAKLTFTDDALNAARNLSIERTQLTIEDRIFDGATVDRRARLDKGELWFYWEDSYGSGDSGQFTAGAQYGITHYSYPYGTTKVKNGQLIADLPDLSYAVVGRDGPTDTARVRIGNDPNYAIGYQTTLGLYSLTFWQDPSIQAEFGLIGMFAADGYVITGQPGGSPGSPSSRKWKFGEKKTAAITTNLTRYIEIDIDGTIYKLVTAN